MYIITWNVLISLETLFCQLAPCRLLHSTDLYFYDFAFVFVSFMTNIRIRNMKNTAGKSANLSPLNQNIERRRKRKVFLCGLRAFVWKELLSFQRVITNEKYYVCIVIFIIFVIGCFFWKETLSFQCVITNVILHTHFFGSYFWGNTSGKIWEMYFLNI